MHIKTTDINLVKNLFKKFVVPQSNSHKGQNGKVMIIGGSSLFHAASLWAAEVCSHFVDMVHYSSTIENEKIFHELKKTFRNGIIVPQKELDDYAKEDDVILVGPGMMRDGVEGEYTRRVVLELIKKFPEKKFVFDAGALQMMDKKWLKNLKTMPILTPHKNEFKTLFGIEGNEKTVFEMAKEYKSVILLKTIQDMISDGKMINIIEGGNAGLTKGGSGDVLSGLAAAFYSKNNAFSSAVFASTLLKITSDKLFESSGYWYNISDIINQLPKELKRIVL